MKMDIAPVLEHFIAGQRELELPFELVVISKGNQQRFLCQQTLRLLPAKRWVLAGIESNLSAHKEQSRVVLKLFNKKRSGDKYFQQEIDGYQRVKQALLPSAELLLTGESHCGRFAVVVYRYLANAVDVEQCWRESEGETESEDKSRLFQRVLVATAKLHNSGCYQSDIHLGNFMLSGEQLYLVDMGSVATEVPGKPLSAVRSRENLALLVAQLFIDEQALLERHLTDYLSVRSWTAEDFPLAEINSSVRQLWSKRKNDYLKKCFRDCTEIIYRKNWYQELACKRTWLDAQTQQLVDNPDLFIENGELLKDGNSATVARVIIADRELVIKRYNMKNAMHRLKRCWRPSRAAVSWRNAHLLMMAGIPTPEPLAMIESRFGPLRGQAYYICEHIAADEMLDVYRRRKPQEQELKGLLRLLGIMAELQISHGDMKAQNFLIDAGHNVAVIDLDAMREHQDEDVWRKHFRKDIRRFMKNWDDNKALKKQFQKIESLV
jgi:tRNA A-37 threonylcarbamoyl transferase component Bud32